MLRIDQTTRRRAFRYPRRRGGFQQRQSPPLGATFEDDVQTTRRLLAAAGFERVVVVDLTRPEFGIPVVMVVIPGMREPY